MSKKFLAVPAILIALLAFAQFVPAQAGIKSTGEECDKKQSRDCDKMKKEDCDKRHSEYCDKTDHKDCDKKGRKYGDNKSEKGGFNILMIAGEIGLSADQEKDIKAIKSSYEKAHIKIDAEIELLKIELKELSRDYDTDIDVYAGKVREIGAKRSDEKIAKFKMKKEIRAVMTPEQRTSVREYYMKKYMK